MKNILIFLIISLITKDIKGQGLQKKEIDFIIVINENIAITSISFIKIRLVSQNKEEDILVDYHPGSLSFNEIDFKRLILPGNNKIYLNFGYREYDGEYQNTYDYSIEIKREWMGDEYLILRVYNLNKKKYKRQFAPVDKDLNYTYEIDSPNYTFKRVRK